MNETVPTSARSAAIPSALASLWNRLFPPLAFDAVLEAEFRAWYADHIRGRVRNAMWIAMGGALVFVLGGGPIHTLRSAVFGGENEFTVDVLRFGFLAPSCIAMLLVVYSGLYARWFWPAAQIVAPLHAMCFIAMDLLMRTQGYSLSAWMPLIVLSPYFLFGMLQASAVRASIMIVIAYALGGYFSGLNTPQRLFDLIVIAFAAAMGAAIHYSLQKSLRQNYLSTQLLNETVHRDALTGIHNRRMFDEHILRLWQQATRAQSPLALLMIDIDHFKQFNDRGGHQAGDACLARVAAVIARTARRPLDLVARYGGEEFAVLMYDAQRDRVEAICRRLHEELALAAIPHPGLDGTRCVTFSIGAACVEPLPRRRHEGFIQLADEALYLAKDRGRNRTVIMDKEYATLNTGSFRVRGAI